PTNQKPMFSNPSSQYEIVPGYTTTDDLGADGDDTIHSMITFYQVPNCIGALSLNTGSSIAEIVDLVYIDFIEPYVALAVKYTGLDIDVPDESDVYMPSITLTDLIISWVRTNWGCAAKLSTLF